MQRKVDGRVGLEARRTTITITTIIRGIQKEGEENAAFFFVI